MLNPVDYMLALMFLYPDVSYVRNIQVEVTDEEARIVLWNLDGPQPTDADILATLPAAQARAADRVEMDEIGAELFERYALHARALTLGKVATAKEIEEEATSLLAYQQEIRDRAPTHPS